MKDAPDVRGQRPAPQRVTAAPHVRRALPVERPAHRYLNAYAFDPSLSLQLENVAINQVTLKVPWEYDPVTGEDLLQARAGRRVPGGGRRRSGERLLLRAGRPEPPVPAGTGRPAALGGQPAVPPADGLRGGDDHDQELRAGARPARALVAALRSRRCRPGKRDEYVQRLRIYPHALREANAYYSPDKKALLFGYFPAPTDDVRFHLPGGMVFCCLSHDVVAHETTHALLDGMHRRFIEPSNVDVLAFHEAFADICALFQHFSLPEVLRQQIAKHARRPEHREPARPTGAGVRLGDRPARRAARRAGRLQPRRPATGSAPSPTRCSCRA